MQIKIIPEVCIACGICQLEAPFIFDYQDNGIVKFKDKEANHLIEDQKESPQLTRALQKCPTGAIQKNDRS